LAGDAAVNVEILRRLVEDDKALILRRRGPHLELLLGNVVLLSSAALETELAFGRLAGAALERMPAGARPRVIVGGLGFGATLRGVLETAPPAAEVVVVEKLGAVADVARAEAAHLVAGALDDPRVVLRVADVADVIAETDAGAAAAILLDVDNGPDWASFRTNARLYAEPSLVRARQSLAPGGIFAVWSGYPADGFIRVLRRAGFRPMVEPLRERGVVRARAYVGVVDARTPPQDPPDRPPIASAAGGQGADRAMESGAPRGRHEVETQP
jgi:predicted membrane-bound spermidine synthase